MRLICPNCDAQYEVPDSVIPAEGRDVQCSDCGQMWFQAHPSQPMPAPPAVDEDIDDTDLDDDIPEPPPPPQQKQVSPSVRDILREEAELEAKARARESQVLESQQELGLDVGEDTRRTRESRERIARLRGTEAPERAAQSIALAAGAPASRRDLLPDIEEINSTLRSASDRNDVSSDLASAPRNVKRRRLGFWGGFLTVLVIVTVLIMAYIYAPQIARAVPQTDPWISNYVAQVDNGRNWLDARMSVVLQWLDETAASQD